MIPKAIGNIDIPTPCAVLAASMNSMLLANPPAKMPVEYTAMTISNIFFLP
jgi:hypothetical protein